MVELLRISNIIKFFNIAKSEMNQALIIPLSPEKKAACSRSMKSIKPVLPDSAGFIGK